MKHKWHKEIKAWADGAEIEFRDVPQDDWKDCGKFGIGKPTWDEKKEYRIKPQPKEEPYWLCCGCKDSRHNKSCSEAKMGHPERCKFGTASEHFKPQPKEPQYLYVYGKGMGIEFTLCKLENRTLVGKIKLEQDDE